METMPIRVQRKRTKGFNLQAQSPDGRLVVSVCRPGKWGNPFKAAPVAGAEQASHAWAVELYRRHLAANPALAAAAREQLRGKHLACYCARDFECHADVLLKLANGDNPAENLDK